jgi:hypothetical protein
MCQVSPISGSGPFHVFRQSDTEASMIMQHTRRRIAGTLLAAVLVVGWGCSNGTPPVDTSTQEATVNGTVKLKGKAVGKGFVIFNPGNIGRKAESRKATIGKDGTYSVTTLIGENTVEVQSPEVMKAGIDAPLLEYKVKEGPNTYDINLPPQP